MSVFVYKYCPFLVPGLCAGSRCMLLHSIAISLTRRTDRVVFADDVVSPLLLGARPVRMQVSAKLRRSNYTGVPRIADSTSAW